MKQIQIPAELFSEGMKTRGIILLILTALLLIPAPRQGLAQSADDPWRYSVMNPTGYPPAIERKALAPRPASLDGKTIYLVDITFNNGDVLLARMQDWLAVNMPGVKTEIRIKTGLYATDDPELWKEIQDNGGLMLMAIGH
jgi:hypothetical protein